VGDRLDLQPAGSPLLRRHGFAEVAPLPGLVKPGFTEILLRKTLGS
jgi:hypothetical protein